MTKKLKEYGKADQAQINAWKAKYPDGIWQYTSIDEDGGIHYTYVRKPDLQDIGVSAKYVESDPVRSGELMFNSVRIGGSDLVKSSGEMKMGVIQKIGRLFKIVEAAEKKL